MCLCEAPPDLNRAAGRHPNVLVQLCTMQEASRTIGRMSPVKWTRFRLYVIL